MLSRVADSIYWMSRYVERAENIARLIDVNTNLILDSPGPTNEQWQPLIMITGEHEPYSARHDEYSRDSVIEYLAFDATNPNSIVSALARARENARSVREVISSEMWEAINTFYLMAREPDARHRMAHEPHDFCEDVRRRSHQFVGVTDTTMTHGEGWHFGRLGRLLERADKTSRIIDVKYFFLLPSVDDVGTPLDDGQWAALLRSSSAFEMYRKRYGRTMPQLVATFLLLDRQFPRSVLYCLQKGRESLHAITGTPSGMYRNLAEQNLGQVVADLSYSSIESIMSGGLHEFVDHIQGRMNRIDDAIFDTFFAMRPMSGATYY